MRRWALALGIVVALALAGIGRTPAHADVGVGAQAPPFDGARHADGKVFALADVLGQWVVFTFGASWCEPCKAELVAYDALAGQMRDVRFLAVNIDNESATGRAFLAALKLRHVQGIYLPAKGSKTLAQYDQGAIPMTFVLDPSGVVRYVSGGYRRGDDAKLRAFLAAHATAYARATGSRGLWFIPPAWLAH